MRWDVHCRVVDNLGDVGFAWRLASDLAARGEQVRLRIDDASALAWMAPERAVEVLPFDTAVPSGEVVVETFGCGLPDGVLRGMASAERPPVWIDVEYLSAEPYAARSHGLPSPQSSGPGAGLRKWFFFPGFETNTGGLIREPDLDDRRRRFDAAGWLARLGLERAAGERIVSLYGYAQPALDALIAELAGEPTLLLAAAGESGSQLAARLGPTLRSGRLRAHRLPLLSQRDYDHLLWAADLNFVRGEDSFVRAQWAGRPFVWQIYPQQDRAHVRKLEAFLERFAAPADVAAFWRGWNGLDGRLLPRLPALSAWREHAGRWRDALQALPDLTAELIRFAAARQ